MFPLILTAQSCFFKSFPNDKEIYTMRGQTIERVFADAKEKHFMRYTYYRGLAKLRMQALLTFAAMNLKKLAKWKKKNALFSWPSLGFFVFWKNFDFFACA